MKTETVVDIMKTFLTECKNADNTNGEFLTEVYAPMVALYEKIKEWRD